MANKEDAASAALRLHEETQRFLRTWPRLEEGAPMPTFTWQALERQLAGLSLDQNGAELASGLVSALRRQADHKPAEMVLREVLCLAAAVAKPSHPESSGE